MTPQERLTPAGTGKCGYGFYEPGDLDCLAPFDESSTPSTPGGLLLKAAGLIGHYGWIHQTEREFCWPDRPIIEKQQGYCDADDRLTALTALCMAAGADREALGHRTPSLDDIENGLVPAANLGMLHQAGRALGGLQADDFLPNCDHAPCTCGHQSPSWWVPVVTAWDGSFNRNGLDVKWALRMAAMLRERPGVIRNSELDHWEVLWLPGHLPRYDKATRDRVRALLPWFDRPDRFIPSPQHLVAYQTWMRPNSLLDRSSPHTTWVAAGDAPMDSVTAWGEQDDGSFPFTRCQIKLA